MARTKQGHAFVWRGGVRINGGPITCDAAGSLSDLVFLSHAQAVTSAQRRPRLGSAGRQEVLATEETLALLGRTGERLRRRVLPASFGRPFALGELRVELLSSGHLPGSASLLVEIEGRRVLYAGAVRHGEPGFGAIPVDVRDADAVCLDATFGDPRFAFPTPAEARGALLDFVERAVAAGRPAVLLAAPFGGALDAADVLSRAGIALRGHRAMVAAATAFRGAGVTVPPIARFDGKLGDREALLWPPQARRAPLLGVLGTPTFAFVSGFSLDPDEAARVGADALIPLTNQSGHADLLAYLESTGASEVALVGGFAEALAAELRGQGKNAYALGPPRQMELLTAEPVRAIG